MAVISNLTIVFVLNLLSIINSNGEYDGPYQAETGQNENIYRDRREARPTSKSHIELHKTAPRTNTASSKNLEKVSIEVQRLFSSFDHKRSQIDQPVTAGQKSEDEMTVVIENDGDDDPEEELREERDNQPRPDQAGFAIILDNTDISNKTAASAASSNIKVDDFSKLSHSYEIMNRRFEQYLSEEKQHVPTRNNPVSVSPKTTKKELDGKRSKTTPPPTPTLSPAQRPTIAGNSLASNIQNLKRLRERLQLQNEAIDDSIRGDEKSEKERSNISKLNEDDRKGNKQQPTKLSLSSPSAKNEAARKKNRPTEKLKKHGGTDKNIDDKHEEADHDAIAKGIEASNSSQPNSPTLKRVHLTEAAASGLTSTPDRSNNNHNNNNNNVDESPRHAQGNQSVNNAENAANANPTDEKIVHPRKAQAMLEYLNKDPLEAWIYNFANLKELGLNSTMLRNGLVNAGSIDRLKSAMGRALKGEDITLSIIGGSISAGGGLYKDEESISGLYYKGLVDWWTKSITPLTGSAMKVNNIAIGSIGTDYFSFCLKSHILNETNIILWELSGNDYNRYLKQPTKGAKPLERLTRMALMLPRNPAVLFINFFKGVDFKKSKKNCPNFEDQGEDIVAHYYKVPSLSWRAMVCEPLIEDEKLFTLGMLFSKDQNHPSLRAHAQMALLLILHLRHVMRSVLQWASTHNGFLPDFLQLYTIPPPLFLGLEFPTPLCWTLITPDFKESIYNTLDVRVLDENGFKLEYATNFPIRFDRVICWKAESVGATMKLQFSIPDNLNQDLTVNEDRRTTRAEVAITTHTRFGGSAEIWLDLNTDNPIVLKEGRENDTGKRTQVDVIAKNIEPGVHTLNLKAVTKGFCLTSIMVD